MPREAGEHDGKLSVGTTTVRERIQVLDEEDLARTLPCSSQHFVASLLEDLEGFPERRPVDHKRRSDLVALAVGPDGRGEEETLVDARLVYS